MKVFEARTLIDTVEARAKQYQELHDHLELLKLKCLEIVNLSNHLEGKGAAAIKEFYQAQIDVIDAWLRLVAKQIGFFNGIAGTIDDRNFGVNTIINVSFLETELPISDNLSEELVTKHLVELRRIFLPINDFIDLDLFSTERFLEHMDRAENKRRETIAAIDHLDYELSSEYQLTEGDEQFIETLFKQLQEATRQGMKITPVHFNAEAFKISEAYQQKKENEQVAKDYLSYKEEQSKFREQLKNK